MKDDPPSEEFVIWDTLASEVLRALSVDGVASVNVALLGERDRNGHVRLRIISVKAEPKGKKP